ncbi:hypothetical protein [Massilia sp. MP_M2]|uniref:hypothetical protein n=1 Tax=Massilia sp. MP_M2 TaxID=3071713 RepID=UPI00319E49A5
MNYIILANPVADWLIALAAMAAVTIGLDALKSIVARRLDAGATQTEPGTPALLQSIAAATLRSTKLVVLGGGQPGYRRYRHRAGGAEHPGRPVRVALDRTRQAVRRG